MKHIPLRSEKIATKIQTIITSAKNAVEYPLRQWIRWRRGIPQFPDESKERLFDHLSPDKKKEALAVEKGLREKYHLQTLQTHSTANNYRVNLFYLEMMDKAFSHASPSLPESLHAADVGASDWFYLRGLHACLQWWDTSKPRAIQLIGYEADAYRIYGNLHSRFDCACAHMQGLENVSYVPKGFSPRPGHFHVLTLFFPFVFLKDHLIWGLPRRKFSPDKLLENVLMSLKKNGTLFIVNQGQAEHETQKNMLSKHGITPLSAFEHASLMYHYNIPRYVLLALKE
jgi:hypothetical protein